jgi:hypothetical protein
VATDIHLDKSSPLGRNGLIASSSQRGNLLFNLNLGELLALLEKFHCLACGRFMNQNSMLEGLDLFNQSGYMR